MQALEDKRVLRAHNFNRPETEPTREEMLDDLSKAKNEIYKQTGYTKTLRKTPKIPMCSRKKEMTVQQLAVLEKFHMESGGIDRTSQALLAKQLKVQKKKIQVITFL